MTRCHEGPAIAGIRGVLALALTFGPVGAAMAQADRELPSLAPMIEAVSPAVVNISVSGRIGAANPVAQEEFLRRFFQVPPDAQQPIQAAGSGVIVDAGQGYILTNHHVVENADRISVTLLDNRSMDARVVGSDQASDLAVLQVVARNLAEMPLGDSSSLRVGDYVVAIGNPFGFAHTVTSGIVSGLGRSGINGPDAYEDFIQTDASINPGNSGGALVNLKGELVGVNSVIVSRGGGNIGIGFAIPVNMARAIMEQLTEFGQVSRGLLGVNINGLTAETAELYGLDDTAGALVVAVSPNSAAERAGIEINDVIVSVNDQRVRDAGSLRNAIGLLRPGTEVEVGVVRDARVQTIMAVLGDAPTAPRAVAEVPDAPAEELDPVFAGAEIGENTGSGLAGILVARVEPGSPAWERGLRASDVITHVNRTRVRNLADATEIMDSARSIILQVQRGTRSQLLLMR
jgi:serine protease Do/serine protease DegQ